MRERSRKPDRRSDFDDDDADDIYITTRRPRRATILDRLFPSMMRTSSFWITAGLILGAYMIVYLFVKDIVIFRAPAGPATNDSGAASPGSPLDYVKRVLTGFAGAYEENVVETKSDGSVVVEQRYTVPSTLVDTSRPTAKVGGVEVTMPATASPSPKKPDTTPAPENLARPGLATPSVEAPLAVPPVSPAPAQPSPSSTSAP